MVNKYNYSIKLQKKVNNILYWNSLKFIYIVLILLIILSLVMYFVTSFTLHIISLVIFIILLLLLELFRILYRPKKNKNITVKLEDSISFKVDNESKVYEYKDIKKVIKTKDITIIKLKGNLIIPLKNDSFEKGDISKALEKIQGK